MLTAIPRYTQSRHQFQEGAALLPRILTCTLASPKLEAGKADLRSARLILPPILRVNLIHRGEILHIRDENIDFYDIFNRCSGFGENGGQVLDTLMLRISIISHYIQSRQNLV